MEDEREEDKKDNIHKKYLKKLEVIMAEMGEEMMDKDTRQLVEKKIKGIFSENGIPFSTNSLKAFHEGMVMSMTAIQSENGSAHMAMTLIICIKGMLKKADKSVENAAEQAMNNNLNK